MVTIIQVSIISIDEMDTWNIFSILLIKYFGIQKNKHWLYVNYS